MRCTFLAILLLAANAFASPAPCLNSGETRLCFAAAPAAPRLLSIASPDGTAWDNADSEPLIGNVEREGKTLPVHWRLNPSLTVTSSTLTRFVYDSSEPRLRLTWEWQVRRAPGPIEHRIRIRNLSGSTLWLPLQSSMALALPATDSLQHWFVEKGADTPSDNGTHHATVVPDYHWSGFSSTYGHPVPDRPREIIPWMLVHDAASNRGLYMGVEFSGRLRLDLARDSQLRVSISLDPEPGPYRTRLAPSEEFEAPTVFLSAFRGDLETASNQLRRWLRQTVISPAALHDAHYPLATNNSWGSGTEVDEPLALRMIRDSAQLGLELFHLDAGWFRAVGDWTPDPKKFPRGLAPIAAASHRAGLKFGLWIDWAQAGASSSPMALNAFDPKVSRWLVTPLPSGWQPEPYKGQTIDISVPAAHAWIDRTLSTLTRNARLDMLEHDGYLVAEGCTQSGHPHAPADPAHTWIQKDAGFLFAFSSNSTDVSYHTTRAYYAIQQKLRREHPGLLLEICNDGGRMVDFGSAAHGDYFSITDTYDPLSNRRAFYDTSWLLPPAMLESYVERWPAATLDNFRYMLRSGMMGWFSIMQETAAWTPQQHEAARQEIALYKSRLRPFIRHADLYHAGPRPDGLHWDGMEYFDPARDLGVVFAFRGAAPGETTFLFPMRGLDPARLYHLEFHDHPESSRVVRGEELLRDGLAVNLPEPNTSELVFLSAVKARK